MKRHKSLSNILVILCGQGLCWPLWATMLLPSASEVQSYFHQGKSLSCVTMPQYTSHCIYCVHSLSMCPPRLSLGRLVTRVWPWSCLRPLPLSVSPLYSGLMRVDDSVPMWGPVTVTRMRGAVSKTMQWCIGGSRVTFDLGRGPFPVHPISTDRLLGNRCDWGGLSWMRFPKTLLTEKWCIAGGGWGDFTWCCAFCNYHLNCT